MKSATAAAEPEEDPPGVCRGLCGLVVCPGLRVANSVVTVLPMMTAPAARAAATDAASPRGRCPFQVGDPYWVGMSAVSSTSLTPMGMPASGPCRARAAARRAWPRSSWAKARIVFSRSAVRSRQASIRSVAVRRPAGMARLASVAVRRFGSMRA
jgi:hypothetical protein